MRLFQIERVNQIKFTTYRAKTILSEASDRFRTVSPICLPEPWTSFPPDTECELAGGFADWVAGELAGGLGGLAS